MINKEVFELTENGLQNLKDELEHLKNVDRPANIEAIKEARAQGDLSENADYDAARNEQAQVEARIKELEYMIEHAIIIEDAPKDVVGLGSTVEIEYVEDGDTDEYKIVGSLEADPFENKISDESPIGASLSGKKVGDVVKVPSPNGDYEVKIVKIS